MVLLSVNAGSSSLKVSVFDDANLHEALTSVSVEGIGTEKSCLIPHGEYGSEHTQYIPIETPLAAADAVRRWLEDTTDINEVAITGIGHRVVHGGNKLYEPTVITHEITEYLRELTPLAPNHMPATLATLAAFQTTYPDTPHVAVFDTGFFKDVPEVAKTLPISTDLQTEHAIRRYGFHGLSYQSLLADFSAHEGEQAAKGRIILAHLGNGASLAAIKDGAPVDMSMGFTPVSGIMMSTRSGDIEPGVLTYLQQEIGMRADDITKMVTHEAGLLGVSELSGDMHTLLQAESDNPKARLAIDLFCYKIKKMIGAYSAVLGGVDSIIFSGGIGERSDEVRRKVCEGLDFLGIIINEERNARHERLISTNESSVGVHVIPAREDITIVTQTAAILSRGQNG